MPLAGRLEIGIRSPAADLSVATDAYPGQQEQEEADQDEDADECQELARPGEEQREQAEDDAHGVDEEDRLAMRQANVEQAVVQMAAIRCEGRATLDQTANDDPEGVDDRHAEDEESNGDLGRPEDRQDCKRVPHEHDPARADEDGRRLEVPPQESEQRASQGKAQDRDERLRGDLQGQAERAEGQRRDQRHPRRQAVEAIDEVNAVDHPDDPQGGETDGERLVEEDVVWANRVVDADDHDPEPDGDRGETELAGELPASTQVEVVVEQAYRGSQCPAEKKSDDPPDVECDRIREESQGVVGGDEDDRDDDERKCHRDAAPAGDWHDVDPSLVGLVDCIEAYGDPSNDRGQDEREHRGRDERDQQVWDSPLGKRAELHAVGSPIRDASAPNPGTGNRAEIAPTRPARWSSSAASSRRSIASAMRAPISAISSGPIPRDVTAGVPTRIPDEVLAGWLSNGIWFLLTVIPISSRRCSASLPVTPSGLTSASMRWLSVPPETSRTPRSERVAASVAAFSTVRRWSRRNVSPRASWNATALPAMTCMSGPPWTPGKTVLSTVAAREPLTDG